MKIDGRREYDHVQIKLTAELSLLV